jgi:acyl-CoA thioester hydrolase
MTFCLRFRVRYGECDGQGVVFNARWGDFVDIAVGEFSRAVFGVITESLDWMLVKQTIEWRAPARYDDVIDAFVRTLGIGTTSFTIETVFSRAGAHLARCETIYVMVDPKTQTKRPVPDSARGLLERGSDKLVDQAG